MTSTDQSELRIRQETLMVPLFPPLTVPHYCDSTAQPSSYHTLSHCLRTNIFPGAPVVWSSLVKDSYVNHPLQTPPPDPQRWYGRRTDDLVRWTERNIINQKLQKALREMEQRTMTK